MTNPNSRARKGELSIEVHGDRLRIRFPRELFGGKQRRMALGLPNTEEGWLKAQQKLRAIQADIELERFDPSLQRYKPRQAVRSNELISLWREYVKYKSAVIKPTTLNYLETSISPLIERSGIDSPYSSLEMREWLLGNTTESMTKRVLQYINAAFRWALRHNKVIAPNPWVGMAQEFKHNWEKELKPNAFTPQEKHLVLQAFQEHRGRWNGQRFVGHAYRHYYPFVQFLFLTGCRPGEAIALTWENVTPKAIVFNGSIYRHGSQRFKTVGSKNNKKRLFPCNNKLNALLDEITPIDVEPQDWVFPSPRGKDIHYGNFSKRAWHSLVDPIKSDTTPYNCRDTFISEQVIKGIPPAIVAQWCDTSTEVIEKYYLGGEPLTTQTPIE